MSSTAHEIASPTAIPQGDNASGNQQVALDASDRLSLEAHTAGKANTTSAGSDNGFATPMDFLKELKKDYTKLPQSYPGYLTRYDLDNITHSGGDASMRAVAAVTADHFDDLQKLTRGGTRDYLTEKDINTAITLESGNVDAYKDQLNRTADKIVLGTTTATTLLTAGALLAREIPPVAGVLAVAAVASIGYEFLEVHSLRSRSDVAQASSDKIKTMMASWSDVNGKH